MRSDSTTKRFDTIVEFTAFENFCSFDKKGYFYQFDKTIIEIFKQTNDDNIVTIEGIEEWKNINFEQLEKEWHK